MGDNRYHSAGYSAASQAYPYNSTIPQQQQQEENNQHLPSPNTSDMYAQHRSHFGGQLPSMATSQHDFHAHQHSSQNMLQAQAHQYYQAHQQSQYQQPSPYSHNQHSYPQQAQHAQSYQQMYQAAPTYQSTVTYGQVAPQSPHPSLVSDENTPAKVEDEEAFRIENPPPPPELHRYNGNIWKLRVVQEPKRARMCGYGDKDRRPISHPPIVQLTITDAETGEEIDYNNGSLTINHFTCLAHLCGIKGYDDKSVLRGHPSQQIISACNTGGYPTATIPESRDRVAPRIQPQQYSGSMYPQNGYPNNTANQSLFPAMDRPPTWRGQYPNMMGPAPTPYGPAPPRPGMQLPPMHSYEMRPQQPPTPPAESPTNVNAGHTFARNLIGATSSSAHLLQDENFKWGIYFLFADLSVRTEDWFRLKFQVFNVAECLDGLTKEEIEQKAASNNAAPSTNSDGKRGSKNLEGIRNSLVGQSAPCLATCWSHCFRVYSAKKFPGVAEGTELMRHFNRQGVKISIRKEKDDTEKGEKGAKQGKKRKAQDEGDAEEGSDFDDLGDD